MIFHPQNTVKSDKSFVFWGAVNAVAHPCMQKAIIKTFWQNFSFQSATLELSACNEYVFSIGNTQKLPLEGFAYSIHVDENGICVYAENEKDLLCGFMTLLDRFEAVERGDALSVAVDCCEIKDRPMIQNRMVHFCVFPETSLWDLQRFVRFCGALKYTHIVLEFWGMLQYDCMKELSWSGAFTKEQIRPIIQEANDLGMEVVPMFNHWGHASACRVMHGKHVVLDQNPALQTYFTEDGWCWEISKPKVGALLRQIRAELIELCGEGGYFHIGCDEAYNFDLTRENMDFICDFINEISNEMVLQNRRILAWGDMFLYAHGHYNPANKYTCNAPTVEVEQYLLSRLSRDVVIADWQYDAVQAPVETAAVFQKAGFDCLLCPWDRGEAQMKAAISTVKAQGLAGFIHTTWHTLSGKMPYVAMAAVGGFEELEEQTRKQFRTRTAALWRKVMPCGGNYERAGWSRQEIDCLW